MTPVMATCQFIQGYYTQIIKLQTISSDASIPVFTNRSNTDTFYTEMADTDPIPILGAYHFLQEIHSLLHLFL